MIYRILGLSLFTLLFFPFSGNAAPLKSVWYNFSETPYSEIQNIVVDGNRAVALEYLQFPDYLETKNRLKLLLLDIEDPFHIDILDEYEFPVDALFNYTLSGNMLYIVLQNGYDKPSTLLTGTIQGDTFRELGTLKNISYNDNYSPTGLYEEGKKLYLNYYNGIQVVDVLNPRAPKLLDSIEMDSLLYVQKDFILTFGEAKNTRRFHVRKNESGYPLQGFIEAPENSCCWEFAGVGNGFILIIDREMEMMGLIDLRKLPKIKYMKVSTKQRLTYGWLKGSHLFLEYAGAEKDGRYGPNAILEFSLQNGNLSQPVSHFPVGHQPYTGSINSKFSNDRFSFVLMNKGIGIIPHG